MFPLDAAARLAALRATGLLDSPADAIFDDLIALAAQVLRVPVALFSLVDDKRQFFKSQIGLKEPWASRRETPLTHSFCQYAVIRGGQLVVSDARGDPLLRDNQAIADLDVIAYAGAPVVADGQPIGVVCAIDGVVRAWSDEDMAVLRRLAAIASREIERRGLDARMRTITDELRAQHALMASMLDSIDDTVAAVDHTGALLLVNRAAERAFGAAAVVDASTRPPAATAPTLGLLDSDGVTPLSPLEMPLLRALAGEVVRGRQLAFRPPATGELRWHSVNASPIRNEDGSLAGAVTIGRDITALKEAQLALEQSATRDTLTGLYNRRGLNEQAEIALRRAERAGRPLTFLFVDVDGLKAINDRDGHAAGDAALVRIAEVLRATFRASDILGRLGGDEFVVVAVDPADDPTGVRVRARLEAALVAAAVDGATPAASIGVVAYDPRGGVRSLDQLLAEADELMYRAKRMRRDQPTP